MGLLQSPNSEYGRYLISQFSSFCGVPQRELAEYDGNGYDVRGFIVHFDENDSFGFIEIIESDKRCQRILFDLRDVIFANAKQAEYYRRYRPKETARQKVIFSVVDIPKSEQLPSRIKRSELRFNKKAINIVSEGRNYLDLMLIPRQSNKESETKK